MEQAFEPGAANNLFLGKSACCFTGHRPSGLPHPCSNDMGLLRLLLMQAIRAAHAGGVRTFLAGGAQGFDQLAAEAVLLQKAHWPDTRLILALPSPTQANRWAAQARQRYEETLRSADEIWYAAEEPSPAAMYRRNRYLVDHADCCIAYLQKPAGGTFYTVRYARRQGLPVYNLALYLVQSFSI